MEDNGYTIFEGKSTDTLVDDIRNRINGFRTRIRETFFAVVEFAAENPQAAMAIGGTLTSISVITIKTIGKQLDIRRENRLRNSMIYDRSLGMYWETKKPLTTNQRLTIESRHNAGESYGAILNDMKVLKR